MPKNLRYLIMMRRTIVDSYRAVHQCKISMKPTDIHLRDLKNIGKAMLADLYLLGIYDVATLANCDPTALFQRLEKITDSRQDPCVWNVFAAAIHEARTGEPTPWWAWTPKRKLLQIRENKN